MRQIISRVANLVSRFHKPDDMRRLDEFCREARYARSHDEVALVEILRAHGGFPVTNPDRQCVI